MTENSALAVNDSDPLDDVSTTRRRRGTGCVEGPSPNGFYRFRCPDGTGRRVTSEWEFSSPEDANRALLALRDQLARKKLIPIRGITFGKYFDDEFIPHCERVRAHGTVKMYKSYFSRVRKTGLADRVLVGLRRADLRRWARAQRVKHPEHFLAIVRAILQQAVEDEFLDSNPASGISIDVPKRDEDERCPTTEEIDRLLKCDAVWPPDKFAILFGLGSGLRPGEWRNLEIADVHLDDVVPYTLVQYGGDNRAPTKTRKKRKVPLIGQALDAMRAWMPLITEYHPKNPHKLVFPSRTGGRRDMGAPFGRIGPRNARRSLFEWYLQQAGIKRHLVPHSLRHGCATSLLTGARGEKLDQWQVQILMGHGRLTTTLRYLHHGESDLFNTLANKSCISPGPKAPEPKKAEKQATNRKPEPNRSKDESCLLRQSRPNSFDERRESVECRSGAH